MSQTLRLMARTHSHRDHAQNPRSPVCATHLRRICGTCTHWTGGLRGHGDCPLYAVSGLASASAADCADCADWSRKTVPQNPTPLPSSSPDEVFPR